MQAHIQSHFPAPSLPPPAVQCAGERPPLGATRGCVEVWLPGHAAVGTPTVSAVQPRVRSENGGAGLLA